MASVHPVFHVSMLNNRIGDPESIFPIEVLSVKDNLSYEGATWEEEDDMKSRYPHLYEN